MPLRLNVGVSRKVGLPSFSSVGASCHIELDLEPGPVFLEADLEGFQEKVRSAYVAANQAVNDELDRLLAATTPTSPPVEGGRLEPGDHPDRPGPPARSPVVGDDRPGRPATPNQVRAIRALARVSGADLDRLLCDLDVARPEDLSLAGASRLIDQLKATGPG